jgi:hypothetical protein
MELALEAASSTHRANPVVVLLPSSAPNSRGPPMIGEESVQHHSDSFEGALSQPRTCLKTQRVHTDN